MPSLIMVLSLLSSWFPVIVWAGLIYYLSSLPSLDTGWGTWDLVLRKLAHVFEYGVLTAFLIRAFKRSWTQMKGWKLIGVCALISILYAASDEFHQGFVPGRGPSGFDVFIDSWGVLGICYLFWVRERWDRKKI